MCKRTLQDLKPGDKARVHKVRGPGVIKRRIMDMGVVPGVEIELERYAPMGDPVEIKIKSLHLSLRKEEAERILLE